MGSHHRFTSAVALSWALCDFCPNPFRISPDSSRMVYVADQDTNRVNELYSVALGGGTVTKLNDRRASVQIKAGSE